MRHRFPAEGGYLRIIICEQVKQVKKLDFIPNEIALFYFVPDLATVPRVHKEENDHFIPYIQDKQPQMKLT